MKWFKRWFRSMTEEAWESARNERNPPIHKNALVGMAIDSKVSNQMNSNPNLMFKMFRASNGFVMEVSHQNSRTHEVSHNLYLISDTEDLGDSISKIITMETLRI